MLLDNSREKSDGSALTVFESDHVWNYYEQVDSMVEREDCNVLDDMVNSNPMVKFISMLAAVVITLLGICALLICCSYFQLQKSYVDLEQNVHNQTRAVGLPDDYEYDEDNIYMKEMEAEKREQLTKRKVTKVEEDE